MTKSNGDEYVVENELEIYYRAINLWGVNAQLDMMIEEMSELIFAIQKNKRNNTDETILKVCEEIADVQIMLNQLKVIYDDTLISKFRNTKMKRLVERILSCMGDKR